MAFEEQLTLPFDFPRDTSGPKEKEKPKVRFPTELAIRCSEEDLRRAAQRVSECRYVQLQEEYCSQCASMRYEDYQKKLG